MSAVLSKAGSYIFIIFAGYILRKKGFFKEEDFYLFSRIVLKITLPAVVIYNFSGKELDISMLSISALALGSCILYMALGYLSAFGKDRSAKAFHLLNTTGFNIGNFTLPFTQSFLGPTGTIITSLFDTGNALIGMGTSYGIASAVKGGRARHLLVRILKTLITSVPFDTYIIMIVLCLLHITPPQPVVTLAEIISGSNAFLAMLMIGVGFKISSGRSQLGTIMRILTVRYTVAVLLCVTFYFLLPFEQEIRRTLAVLAFSPIASVAPAFTAELKEDVGLSSAINSISIVISIPCIVAILSLTS